MSLHHCLIHTCTRLHSLRVRNSINIPEKLQVFIGPEYGDRYYNTYHPILFLFIKDLERDKLKIIHSMQHMVYEKKQLDIKHCNDIIYFQYLPSSLSNQTLLCKKKF